MIVERVHGAGGIGGGLRVVMRLADRMFFFEEVDL